MQLSNPRTGDVARVTGTVERALRARGWVPTATDTPETSPAQLDGDSDQGHLDATTEQDPDTSQEREA